MTHIGKSLQAYWLEIREDFLRAVDETQREQADFLLRHPNHGGSGLRQWLGSIVAGASVVPIRIPIEIIDVYLKDNSAVPLHSCEECELVIPVHRNWEAGEDFAPIRVCFDSCPACGGAIGPFGRRILEAGRSLENA